MPPERVAWLVAGYLRQTLSEKEHDELDEWVTASDDNQRLFEEMIDPKNIDEGIKQMKDIDTEAALREVKAKIPFSKQKKSGRTRMLQYGVAAAILLIAGIYFVVQRLSNSNKTGTRPIASEAIKPGGNKATLTLATGKTIDLEAAKNGLLDSAGGTDVLKTADGQLSYESNGQSIGLGSHVLTTPAGGQYKITLPDGSRVWLNASSSLKYPVTFTGKERIVELSGEGYFEVAKEKPADITGMELGRRFIVKLRNDARVEVLGTHFNIMAYDNEGNVETTLLEGSVSVKSQTMGSSLSPGDKGTILKDGVIEINQQIDTNYVVAWKNGKFQFKDAPIESIMRQVARWYDAEIIYEGRIDYHFNATTIYRSEPLSKLLMVLEETNRVHFSVDGKKIVVRP